MMEHLFANPYLDWITQLNLYEQESTPKEYDQNQVVEVDFKVISTEADDKE